MILLFCFRRRNSERDKRRFDVGKLLNWRYFVFRLENNVLKEHRQAVRVTCVYNKNSGAAFSFSYVTKYWSIKELLLRSSKYSPHVRESRTFLDSGFHAVDSGFQHSGFRIPKSAGFQFFTVLMLFFAFRFRVRILLYWKTLLQCITSLFSFSIYKLRVECITVP